jgi:hypothetical protein
MKQRMSVALCVAASLYGLAGCGSGSASTPPGTHASRAAVDTPQAKVPRLEHELIYAFHAYEIAANAYGPKSPHATIALHEAMLAGLKAASVCKMVPGCPVSPIEAINRHLRKIDRLEDRLRQAY